jgi:predicted nucleic acid-binding protein
MFGSVLVDSSYYIGRLRAGEDPFEDLAYFSDNADFITCGAVKTEVLRGVKVRKAYDRLEKLFGAMIYVPTSNRIWERVQQLAWAMDRDGLPMQVTDLIIAASALEAEAAVLTFDSDFRRVPGLSVLDGFA